MLIYIHVPFCRLRCKYCAFFSLPLGRNQRPENSADFKAYTDTLLLEAALWGQRYRGERVETIFFGGGTPSLLPAKFVATLLDRLAKYFSIDANAEVTLEANPESLKGTLQPTQYLEAGVNRLSIGLQSLDGDMLRTLGRVHKSYDGLNALSAAREAGFANLSVDLMWGLPGQSVRHWINSLKEIVKLAPEHISAYGLTLEPGTVLEQECQSGKLKLPPERDQNIMFMDGSDFLQSQGYLHYEISNFARMGYQCRHNLGYWRGEDYLGLGPSATTTIDNLRLTNPADQKIWAERIRCGVLGGNEEELTPLIRVLEMIMLSLRTSTGLSFKRYQLMTGRDFLTDHMKMVQALHENGLVRIMNGHMRLTTSGMLVSNSILSNLFELTEKILQNSKTQIRTDVDRNRKAKDQGADKPEIRDVVWPKA